MVIVHPKNSLLQYFFKSLFFLFFFVLKIIHSSTDQTLGSFERATAANKHFCKAGSRPHEGRFGTMKTDLDTIGWSEEKIKMQDYSNDSKLFIWISSRFFKCFYTELMSASKVWLEFYWSDLSYTCLWTWGERQGAASRFICRLSLLCSCIGITLATGALWLKITPENQVWLLATVKPDHVCSCTDKINIAFEWNTSLGCRRVDSSGQLPWTAAEDGADDCCSSEVTECIHWTDAALGYSSGLQYCQLWCMKFCFCLSVWAKPVKCT